MLAQRHLLSLVGAALLIFAAGRGAEAAATPRQWYNDWTFYPQYGYYYSSYYFQPAAGDQGYKHHFCIYYPSTPRYVYYFDPESRQYWGRLDIKGEPGHRYSLLPPKVRKEKLKDIPEDAFPKAGTMPPIPESTDGIPMEPVKVLPKVAGREGKSSPETQK